MVMSIVFKISQGFGPKQLVSSLLAMICQQQHVTRERFVREWKKEWSSQAMGTWVLEKLEEPWLR